MKYIKLIEYIKTKNMKKIIKYAKYRTNIK